MTTPSEDDRAERLRQAIRLKQAAARSRGTELPPRPADRAPRLGELQRSLWLLHRMEPDSAAYNLTSAFRAKGPLDRVRLERGFHALLSRHRILRSGFRAAGGDVEQVIRPALEPPLEVVDAGRVDLLEAATREARRPFELEAGPLIRLVLVEQASQPGPVLLLSLHHILADERSLAILWQELAAAYDGREPADEAVAQYDDFVHWQGQRDPAERAQELAYWRRQLDPLPDDLALPFERVVGEPRPGGGRLLTGSLADGVAPQLRRLAAELGITPFALYAFGFRLLLQRYTQGRDVAFATPASLRSHPATARMIGYFLNPVVVEVSIDEERSARQAAADFGQALRERISRAALPFDVLAEACAPPRQRDRHPIFQAMFVYQREAEHPRLGEVELEPVTLDLGVSKFDLTLFVSEDVGAARLAVEYRSDRFDEVWMRNLMGHYGALLEGGGRDPEQRVADLPMLTVPEERWLREHARGPALEPGGQPLIPHRIVEQARRAPGAPALVCGEARWSYGELERCARAIAHGLAGVGVVRGDRVGLFLERSPQMAAGVLGCHLAGAAYVPLDPGYPAERNADVLADAEVSAVVTQAAVAGHAPAGPWPLLEVERLPADAPPGPALPELDAGTPAYLLYTSGSTGRPKGVVVTHENLRASTAARLELYERPPRRFLLLPSLAFDSSVAGIFWTLASGGALVLPTEEAAADPLRLTELIAAEGVTDLLCVPSLYALMLRTGADELAGLSTAIVAGESCPSQLVGEHFRALPQTRLYNEYGPTEGTVWATVHALTERDAERPVAIGRPIPGVRVEVLDGRGRRVPTGLPGEAWIAGATVAEGYWRRPKLTAERFQVLETGDGVSLRAYRTGDRLTWTPDGRLLFGGREDEQIKLRGFRIEPGEVEAALLEASRVREAAVVARTPGGDSNNAQLVGFVETTDGISTADLREQLARRLPAHMIPSRFVALDELPHLPNGKVDRARLRDLEQDPGGPAAPSRLPSSREQDLVALWEGLLGRPGIDLSDNFFELGGHSLLVVEMVAVIERDYGVTLVAADVFQYPTVEELARRIEERTTPAARHYAHLFPIQPRGSRPPILFCVPHFFSAIFASHFRGERPVYGLRGVSLRPEGNLGRWRTMTELGEDLAEEIERRFPEGPLILAGYSFGASMAVEATRLLEERNRTVQRLVLITPMPLNLYRLGPLRVQLEGLRKPLDELTRGEALRLFARTNDPLTRRPYGRLWLRLAVVPWRRLLCLLGKLRRALGLPLSPGILYADVRVDRFRLHARYRPEGVRAPTVIFNGIEPETDAAATWRPVFQGPLSVHPTPDPHSDEASIAAASELILRHLEDLEEA